MWSPRALLAILLGLLVLAGFGRSDQGGTAPPSSKARAVSETVVAPVSRMPRPVSVPAAWTTVRDDARPSFRVGELRRLRRSRTVEAALRRAWLTGAVDARRHDADRRTWAAARRAARVLRGRAGDEQRGVVRLVEGLARARALTSTRLPAVLLTLRRNTSFWTVRPMLPRASERFRFGRDPVVLAFRPGQGLQIQWLGTWGRVNARARVCLARPGRCPRRALTREFKRLVGLGARRSGYTAYEGLYAFGGGAPPWVSGMVQGTAVQALARGRRALAAPRLGLAARRALGAFERRPPQGVSVADGSGRHFLMYSFAPGLRILNGHLQAVTGLHDARELLGSRRAGRLFVSGERSARPAVGRADTGAWSLYSANGRESTLGYHRLVDGFLENLCRRTRHDAYCGTARRFARYEREPPRIGVRPPRRARTGRPAAIAVTLSKVSRIAVEVRGRRGLALRRVLELTRGRHAVTWTPRVGGRFVVSVVARGPSGPAGRVRSSLRVTSPTRKESSDRDKEVSETPTRGRRR